jgi:hypothetical protein
MKNESSKTKRAIFNLPVFVTSIKIKNRATCSVWQLLSKG